MELIPYIGPILGALPPVLVALFTDPISALWVALLFIGLQQLEGHVVAPQIFGHTLRINPLLVIFALLLGLQVHGIIGALIALPILAVLRETAVYLQPPPDARTVGSRRQRPAVSAALSVRALAKRYGELQALRDVSFEAARRRAASRSSGPTAPARRRCCRSSPAVQPPSAGERRAAGRGEVGWAPQQPAAVLEAVGAPRTSSCSRAWRASPTRARRSSGCSSRPACASAPASLSRASPAATASASTSRSALIAEPARARARRALASLDPGQRERLWEFIDGPRRGRHERCCSRPTTSARRALRRPRARARRGRLLFDGAPAALLRGAAASAAGGDLERALVRFLGERERRRSGRRAR